VETGRELGFGQAHYWLGEVYRLEGVDLKKAKFHHYEAAAMAGHKVSRFNVGRVVSRVILEKWNELLRIGQLQH
jgi:hypothetical protein